MPENNERRPPEDRRTPHADSDRVSKRGLRDEIVVFHREGFGKVMAVLPVVPDDAPYRVREGVARRRIAAVTGTCPCGATTTYAAVELDGMNVAEVLHKRLCPADTDRLAKEIRRWSR